MKKINSIFTKTSTLLNMLPQEIFAKKKNQPSRKKQNKTKNSDSKKTQLEFLLSRFIKYVYSNSSFMPPANTSAS